MKVTDIQPRDPRLCIGHNRAGAPCNKFARRGQRVCRNHGGSSPQALAKAAADVELADLRLRNLAPRAVATLEDLVINATSEQVRLGAANSLVDRSVGASHRTYSGCGGDHGEAAVVEGHAATPSRQGLRLRRQVNVRSASHHLHTSNPKA